MTIEEKAYSAIMALKMIVRSRKIRFSLDFCVWDAILNCKAMMPSAGISP